MEFREITFSEISAEKRELLKEAFKVMKNAYNIYSGYYVGAAVLTKNGAVYHGVNLENASFGVGLCAEIAAIQSAFTAGDPFISMIAIVTGSEEHPGDEVAFPCGRCRQVLSECSTISKSDIEVICSNRDMTKIVITSISKLLPVAFSSSDLKKDNAIENYIQRIQNE